MKKLIASSAMLGLLLFLVIGNIGGCNDTPCQFNLNAFFNGTSLNEQTSEWDCKRGGETVFTLGLFSDLTGTRSDIGDFVFERTKCRTLEFGNDLGVGKLKSMQGNINIGTLSFVQVSDDFGDTNVVCDLVEF